MCQVSLLERKIHPVVLVVFPNGPCLISYGVASRPPLFVLGPRYIQTSRLEKVLSRQHSENWNWYFGRSWFQRPFLLGRLTNGWQQRWFETCTIKGKVCSLTSSSGCACGTKSGYQQEKSGIWRTLKGWFSFYEINRAASQGGYFEWYS